MDEGREGRRDGERKGEVKHLHTVLRKSSKTFCQSLYTAVMNVDSSSFFPPSWFISTCSLSACSKQSYGFGSVWIICLSVCCVCVVVCVCVSLCVRLCCYCAKEQWSKAAQALLVETCFNS
jgi:hypothetical protein